MLVLVDESCGEGAELGAGGQQRRPQILAKRTRAKWRATGRVRGFMKAGQLAVKDYSKARLMPASSRLFGSVPTNRGSLRLRHPYL